MGSSLNGVPKCGTLIKEDPERDPNLENYPKGSPDQGGLHACNRVLGFVVYGARRISLIATRSDPG